MMPQEKSLATSKRPTQGKGRILLVTPQPFFEDRGTPIAVRMVARALGQIGYEIDLLSFPIGRGVDLPGTTLIKCGNPFSIQTVRIGFSLKKLVLDASLMRAFSERLDQRRYDAVHAVEEAAYMAALLCPARGIPFVFDMASIIPEELGKKPFLRALRANRMAAALERLVLDKAAHVICSMGLRAHVRTRSARIQVDEWKFPAAAVSVDPCARDSLRASLQVPAGSPVLLYAGNFASYQGMGLLLQAFEIARAARPDLVLVCVGATEEERAGIMNAVSPEMAANLRIVLRQRRRDMPAYLAAADVLVSPRTCTGNVPLKIFDYLAAARPIVATRGNGHEPLLDSSRAVMCDPVPEAFARGLLEAVESPWRARELTRNALRYSREHLSWEAFERLLGRIYQAAINESHVDRVARAA